MWGIGAERRQHWGTVPPVECEILTSTILALHGNIEAKVGGAPVGRSRFAASGVGIRSMRTSEAATKKLRLWKLWKLQEVASSSGVGGGGGGVAAETGAVTGAAAETARADVSAPAHSGALCRDTE